ncbi:MAG: PEP-CTERM sorting domain-containing protein [Gemmatimonadota bacterium]|nr:PEP-CTERM sorting domain-containing protein [Gemmatimonadota bacterium]
MKTGILGAAALVALTLTSTNAQAQSRDWLVCGGTTFNTCAAVQVSVSAPDLLGVSNVTMKVWNMSGYGGTFGGTVFTKIGFFNTGAVTTVAGSLFMTGPVRSGDSPAMWQLGDPNNAGGISLDFATSANGGSSSVDNSIANACDPGESPSGSNQLWENPCYDSGTGFTEAGWITITFQVQGSWDLASTEMLIQGQNGPNGDSTQCITGEGGNCSVVPEPMTLLLLGTGLAGVGGVQIRRRREDEEEDLA